MSNVLMGLIGVVLFVGLAMLAVNNFGSSVMEGSSNGRAVAALAATQQIAHAVTLVRMYDGVVLDASADLQAELVDVRFLKVLPVNPILTVSPPFLTTDSGALTGEATAAVMSLGANSAVLCRSIARSTGQIASVGASVPVANAIPAYHDGCFKASAGGGAGLTAGIYYSYSRI